MKEKIDKKKSIIALAFVLFLTIIGGTLAIIYRISRFNNIFKSSAYNVSINEEFNNEWGTKKVSVVNNDNTPLIIRVMYSELWSSSGVDNSSTTCELSTTNINQTEQFILSNKINGNDTVTKNWTSNWKNYFIEGEDGWYYYTKVLNNKSSVQILSSISLNRDLIRTSPCYQYYNEFNYNLDFNYEAIQATPDAIRDIWGFDVSINGGNVTWNF